MNFEQRIDAINPTLTRWIVRTFGPGFPELDDCLQAASITLWKIYSRDKNRLDSASTGLWVVLGRFAIRNYLHSANAQVSRRQGKRGEPRRSVQIIYTESDLTAHDDDRQIEEMLSAIAYGPERRGSKTRTAAEIAHAELCIDLERILTAGFARLEDRYHADMKRLMLDIMHGYKLVESQTRHNWTQNHAATLKRLLREVFRDADPGPQAARRDADEAGRIRALHAKGLSYAKIAAHIGRSPSYVQQKIKPPTPRNTEQLDLASALRDEGLSYRVIGQALGCSKAQVVRLLQTTFQ